VAFTLPAGIPENVLLPFGFLIFEKLSMYNFLVNIMTIPDFISVRTVFSSFVATAISPVGHFLSAVHAFFVRFLPG